MAITPGICASFKLERDQGIHVFPTDTLKIALYTSSASLSPDTTAYTTSGEASGAGYTAGGKVLSFTSGYPKLNTSQQGDVPASRMLLYDFEDITFNLVNITDVLGALIYNSSKSNRAVAVIHFGQAYNPGGDDLLISWPTPDTNNAIIRSY